MSANLIRHARTKHVELDLYFLQKKSLQKAIEVRHVPGVDQVADVFTKAFSSPSFRNWRSKLRVKQLPPLSLRGPIKDMS